MERNYRILQEKLYHEELENGLSVYVVPETGIQKPLPVLPLKYGALINRFVSLRGKGIHRRAPGNRSFSWNTRCPRMPDGTDAAELFAKMGLDANASTSHLLKRPIS